MGDLDHLTHYLVDALGLFPGPVGIVRSPNLGGHVDDSAGIDNVVGRVQNAPPVKVLTVLVGGQLIIGSPGYHPAFEPGNGFLVQDSTQRAGREYVAVLVVNLLDADHRNPHVPRPVRRRLINVGNHQPGVLFEQVVGHVGGYLPESLHSHLLAR